ncbi:MAG: hypothetical protein M1825_002887 [Sarcosagium campestre]|nr:MAG: hypothetical protein M1825_002887 [Sarcosagium campestre]
MGLLDHLGFKHYALESDSPEFEAVLQKKNELNTAIFYGYIGLVFFIFALTKLIRYLYIRNRYLRKDVRVLAIPTRLARRWFIKKAFYPWATRGHAVIITGYLIINIVVCFVRVSSHLKSIQLARRTGWMSAFNFSFLILLSMKNTPLSKLTGYSYERLNVFHRWVGITAQVQGVVHTIAISAGTYMLVPRQTFILIKSENIMGIVALAAWTIMMLSFPALRKRAYEWFYAIHMIFFPVVALALFLHNKHCREPVLAAVGLYTLDRLIRSNRYIWHNRYSRHLKASLQVTDDGATLLSIPRSDFTWRPGSHAFVNVPRLRYFQSHPFTIASVGDDLDQLGHQKTVRFLIRPKSGFTKALFAEAKKSEGQGRRRRTKDVTAYVDGPYGSVPDFNAYDRVILIAAGSGVTFILPIAVSLVRRGQIKSLQFIWSVRDESALTAVQEQLREIASPARHGHSDVLVDVRLHITGKMAVQRKPTVVQRLVSVARRQPQHPYQYNLYGSSVSLAQSNPRSAAAEPIYEGTPPLPSDSSGLTTPNQNRWSFGEPYAPRLPSSLSPGYRFTSPPARHARTVSYDSAPGSSPAGTLDSNAPLLADDIGGKKTPEVSVREVRQFVGGDLPSLPLTPGAFNPPPPPPSRSRGVSNATVDGSDRDRDRDREGELDHGGGRGMAAGEGLIEGFSSGNDDDDDDNNNEDEKSLEVKRRSKRPKVRDDLARFHVAGRPDLPRIIRGTVDDASELDTIAIGACGVTAMTDEIRAVVADSIGTRGPSLSLFCEEFGW